MRTANIMSSSNSGNLPKAPNFKPGTESNFKDIFSDKLSAKDSNPGKDRIREDNPRETNAKPVNHNSKDQKELDEKQEKRIRRKRLEELQMLLSAEGMEELEIPEELETLLQKISELGEQIQQILGELLEQGGLSEALSEKVEALVDLDISLGSLLTEGLKSEEGKVEEGKVEEAKTLESLTKLLEGLQEITEKVSANVEKPKDLEKLLKAQEEMKALVEEGLKKVAMMKETVEKNPSKNVESLPVTGEDQIKESKSLEKAADELKAPQEANGQEKNTDKNIKDKDASLMKDSSNKENSDDKEKSSKVSLSLETKEEQPLERSFLFNSDKVENFEKLSAMIQKNNTDFQQNLSQMIEEMTEKISIMKNGEASQIKMQLVPNNLGKLVIQLSTDENVLSARVYADSPKVKEMIEGQLEELKEALIDKGLTVESLEVFVGHEQDRALYQKHGPMMMAGQNKSSQISFAEIEAMEEAALKSNPYVEKYQYNRLV